VAAGRYAKLPSGLRPDRGGPGRRCQAIRSTKGWQPGAAARSWC